MHRIFNGQIKPVSVNTSFWTLDRNTLKFQHQLESTRERYKIELDFPPTRIVHMIEQLSYTMDVLCLCNCRPNLNVGSLPQVVDIRSKHNTWIYTHEFFWSKCDSTCLLIMKNRLLYNYIDIALCLLVRISRFLYPFHIFLMECRAWCLLILMFPPYNHLHPSMSSAVWNLHITRTLRHSIDMHIPYLFVYSQTSL